MMVYCLVKKIELIISIKSEKLNPTLQIITPVMQIYE